MPKSRGVVGKDGICFHPFNFTFKEIGDFLLYTLKQLYDGHQQSNGSVIWRIGQVFVCVYYQGCKYDTFYDSRGASESHAVFKISNKWPMKTAPLKNIAGVIWSSPGAASALCLFAAASNSTLVSTLFRTTSGNLSLLPEPFFYFRQSGVEWGWVLFATTQHRPL